LKLEPSFEQQKVGFRPLISSAISAGVLTAPCQRRNKSGVPASGLQPIGVEILTCSLKIRLFRPKFKPAHADAAILDTVTDIQTRSSAKRILLSWSGGKDSAWALHLLRRQPEYEVVALLTTINESFRRVAIHGTRETLLELQAEAAGLPLWKVDLPFPCSNAEYEARMAQVCARAVAEGLHGIAFGDLFLEDIRAYRIARLAGTGLEPIFPVWTPTLGISTTELAREMLAAGVRAHLTCIDPRVLDRSFAGRAFDATLLGSLPDGVDPCGERGEFHSFAFAGPMFSRTIWVIPGAVVERDNFIYADLLPAPGPEVASPQAPSLHLATAHRHRSVLDAGGDHRRIGADAGPAGLERLRL
jgi:uncharacterized protein (TIGR00290 family)